MKTITIFDVWKKVGECRVKLGELASEDQAHATEAAAEAYGSGVEAVAAYSIPFGKDGRDLSAEANSEALDRLRELEYGDVLKHSVDDNPIAASAKRRAMETLEGNRG